MSDFSKNYNLTLTTRSPLFIGNGNKLSPLDYDMNEQEKTVSFIDRERMIRFLMERPDLAEEYETRVLSGGASLNGMSEKFIRALREHIAELAYSTVSTRDMGSDRDSKNEIHTFIRQAGDQIYIPGSSVKGAIRTAVLYGMITGKTSIPYDFKDYWRDNENKLRNKMAQISVSDSVPISVDRMILVRSGSLVKRPDGSTELKAMPYCLECVEPGTVIQMKLTLYGNVTPKSILDDITGYAQDYSQYTLPFFLSKPEDYGQSLLLGASTGYFTKTVTYPYYVEDAAAEVSRILDGQFKKHGHAADAETYGISPHTLHRTMDNQPFGWCQIDLEEDRRI